jgi:hypothetical protein
LLLIAVLLTILQGVLAIDAESARASCLGFGFDVDTLLCGTCSRLRGITPTVVVNHCLKCCQSPYDRARLVVTQMALMRSSGLNEFVSSRINNFGSLVEVEVLRTTEEKAQLVLTKNGKDELSVRVMQWSAGDLEDYLGKYFPKS